MLDLLDRWLDRDAAHGRKFRRDDRPLAASLVVRGVAWPCGILNISPGGACVRLEQTVRLAEGARVAFDLDDYGRVPARVRYTVSRGIGLEFTVDDRAHGDLAVWLGPPAEANPA